MMTPILFLCFLSSFSIPVVQAFRPFEMRKESTTSKLNAETIVKNSKFVDHAKSRKRWGIDNEFKDEYFETEYWFDSRIHTLGNSGISGALHAAIAALSTKVIDVVAYDGIDIRHKLAFDLSSIIKKDNINVVDLCCGVGISTRALRDAFPNAKSVVGIDTSPEMVAMAEFLTDHTKKVAWARPIIAPFTSLKLSTITSVVQEQKQKICRAAKFMLGNAEETSLPARSFDLVTIMYALHEAPKRGREKILEEAKRLLQPGGTLAVIDISTDYIPSKSMLAGEPYVIEYQKNIDRELRKAQGFHFLSYEAAVPGRVGMWMLKKTF